MRIKTRVSIGSASIVLAVLLLSKGCADGQGWGTRQASDVPPPVRHAVHTDELQRVMSGLGKAVASTWPQEIQAEMRDSRSTDYEKAEQLARRLAETTRILPGTIRNSEMSAEDREVFLANVDLLASQASQLEASAREHRLQEMRRILGQIQTTCYGCHSQFRGEPGPLKFGS